MMDLSDVSRRQALADIDIARVRVLQLTLEINKAASELAALRAELGDLDSAPSSSQAPVIYDLEGPATLASKRSSLRRIFHLPTPKLSRLQPRKKSELRWHLDEISGQFPLRTGNGIDHKASFNSYAVLTVSGWAVPLDGRTAFSSIKIVMKGQGMVIIRQVPTFLRDDVAAHFDNSGFASSGFRFDISMSEMKAGVFTVDLAAYSPGQGEVSTRIGRLELG